MRRAGHLFDIICSLDNLREAFWKAQQGKCGKSEVILFRNHLDDNLLKMHHELLEGKFSIGNYHYFTIHDPKERMICAADFRDRILHHAIMNVCEEKFERFQIYDSYASRTGKGVDGCLKRTQHLCRNYRWYVKLDIHKYFDSIDHHVLFCQLNRLFKDPHVLQLLSQIIDSYQTTENRGIPIGNLTSQFFANQYLGSMDHLIKDNWRIPGYVRYMDDFLLFHDDRTILEDSLLKIRTFLSEKLHLELNPVIQNRCQAGIPFLSYVIYPDKMTLSQKARRRFRDKIRIANKEENQEKALALLAFVNRADTYAFRKNVFKGK